MLLGGTMGKSGRITFKQPVSASRGVVCCNHPIASSAALTMLASGGSAADAAVAAAFTLTVVEPMMIGPLGGGYVLYRSSAGVFEALDNYATGPGLAREDMYQLEAERGPLAVKERKNEVGHLAAGVPGNIKGWWHLHQKHGRLPISQVIAPAIWYAENGYPISEYGVQAITNAQADLARFPAGATVFLAGGKPPSEGERIVNRDLAESLRLIEREGPDAVYGGAIGAALVKEMQANGGIITREDLSSYDIRERTPLSGTYRGYEIVGTPLSSGGGLLNQLGLNILENFDVPSLGFGSARYFHLLIEVFKIMYADRARYLGDPDFVSVPQERLLDKDYARKRAKEIDMDRAGTYSAADFSDDARSSHTTHFSVMTADGEMVSATQTLNNPFGCKVMVPGTGLFLNNNMALFDPRPGLPNSPAPGKRMLTATAATIVQRHGQPYFSIGTPGGIRIFPSVFQGILNVIDHGMDLQEAVEAPRIWTMGRGVEVEPEVPEGVRAELEAMGHRVSVSGRIAGGMNGIQFEAASGMMLGAACWRADGSPAGLSGGFARPDERGGGYAV